MSSENTVADRLLTEARRKTARQQRPVLGTAALALGVLAVLASVYSLAGWIAGGIALAVGGYATTRPDTARQGRIAMVLGFVALVISTFFFTLVLALR